MLNNVTNELKRTKGKSETKEDVIVIWLVGSNFQRRTNALLGGKFLQTHTFLCRQSH